MEPRLAGILFDVIEQRFDALHPPDTFRNADNPYYWKNRPPYEGYWQQDVHYRIKARLDENTDVADGSETLTYWNNSPDTLRFVFFHLYQEAYNAGSYMDKLDHAQDRFPPRDPKVERGTEIPLPPSAGHSRPEPRWSNAPLRTSGMRSPCASRHRLAGLPV